MIQPVYKPLGLTPLQVLEKFREKHPNLSKAKMTYAGRLDPMAEGVMVVLVDESEDVKQQVLAWDKVYEFEMLVGVATDTNDVLGIVDKITQSMLAVEKLGNKVGKLLKDQLGSYRQTYPAYSSKTVKGKPLWLWAQEGKLADITLPSHKVTLYEVSRVKSRVIDGGRMVSEIIKKINLVSGDFRQDEVRESWGQVRPKITGNNWPISRAEINCSSGFYVRQLVYELGKALRAPVVTYHILRKKVGPYSIGQALQV